MDQQMSNYYDRDGNSIDMWTWASKFEDRDYRIVASTEGDGWRVSTIWLGLDHSWWGAPPLIFETMVFGLDEEPQERYSTEAQARAGHAELVEWARVRATAAGDGCDDAAGSEVAQVRRPPEG